MKDPQFYLECGYEDTGYVSPNLTSSEIYPDYIEQEVMETVRSVQEKQTHNTITFGFMTDLHLALTYNHKVRMQRNLNAYREICKRAQVDFLALGGDYTNEGSKPYKSDCYRQLRAYLDGIDYYPVNGNHDDGSIWDLSYLRIKTHENWFSHDDLYRLFYNHLPQKGIKVADHSLYYYKNDNYSKTRYIFLDTNDVPETENEDGTLKYPGQSNFKLSQKQIDWLVNEALSFDEEGWSVILFGHSDFRNVDTIPVGEGDSFEGIRIMHDILGAYKNGAACNVSYGENEIKQEVDVDFSKRIRADLVAMFVGDHHLDAVDNYYGVNYILTANSVTYYTGESYQVPRADGDKTEILFDIVTVDKKDRTIYVTRMGAGEDRIVKY